MALCEALKARVWDELRPRLRAGGSDDDHDSQRIAVVTRLAAEMAILGGEVKVDETTQTMTVTGRSEITEEDWALAELIADTSRSIKAYAIAERREKDAKAQQIRRARNLAESIEDEDLRGTPVGRAKAPGSSDTSRGRGRSSGRARGASGRSSTTTTSNMPTRR
jgi:hypothetical protein